MLGAGTDPWNQVLIEFSQIAIFGEYIPLTFDHLVMRP